ncbi:arabinosyltransferase domain-containing protein [Dietzia cinnamea]|uniref:Arabinosyltransferase domain-containing protein n=1 Tax=Dietzia cinnamea TaxID=321318 RepID=A0AAW5Q9Q1_9ACTN|nr:arabinosyltransferase domain-containing protein [Dietzia cinnamea]MCT1641079.1 arabinosyltransferase domain-containing protein [Dietzia cinnamea]MCT1865313.1 arabinosyltransferase domain-containing protein [Dietzia cinnamea]MCT2031347.1 arabinosyltransferase domain-containing protein [Dietzia cinnamea]MCT2034553.1 arabinosyltransferase domain-containing protein [Dietzia cinnamea]MCT2062892.1 arabinosyltransferase domain-containing protein [Dietzia cinnamea]
MSDSSPEPSPAHPPAPSPASGAIAADPRVARLRLIAIVSGLVGTLCFLALPFLPVSQTTSTVQWPQNGSVGSVTAPLMAHSPQRFTATAPCDLVGGLPADGGILLSTAPAGGEEAGDRALFVRASADTVDVVSRNRVIVSAPRDRVEAGDCTQLSVVAAPTYVEASFDGIDGAARRVDADDLRPMVVGVYTDLPADTAVPEGLDVTVQVDSRFTTYPTAWKWAAIVIGLLSTAVALWALHALDQTDGRRARRFLPRGWFRIRPPDIAVIGTLGVWHFVGGNTSDDGYILSMARAADPAGYMANYYRWYGVPESPFGSPYYDLLTLFSHVSTASPWMRLPALLAAILCWLVLSREVLPRLGRAARTTPVVVWSAAAVFLAFWMAFNNGLRPEPIIALGALLTWVSVERAIATRRMLPFAIAVIIASFSLATGPTGLMAVAALLMGLRAVVRTVVIRGRVIGSYLALVAPVLASGTMVLICVFGVQTLAAVLEAIRVRGEIGPSLSWFEEFVRYYYLMIPTVDGSLARRLPVLLVLLCLAVVVGTLLRRGKVPGAASGPVWRLVGVVVGTAFFMMFSPTKWTHHFGVYAGIGGAIAALGALAISASAVRTARNRTLFLGVILVVVALAFAGPNGWWYVSSYGIPWWDKAPSIRGIDAATVLLVLAVLTFAYAGWQHLRRDYIGDKAPRTTEGRRRVRTFAAAPIAVVAGLLVIFSIASFAKGVHKQFPAYTIAEGNLSALAGNPCMLADRVLVEPDANAGMLTPLDATPLPDGTVDPQDRAAAIEAGGNTGFTPDGVAPDLSADAVVADPGAANTTSEPGGGPSVNTGESAGTGGGRGAEGVNSSTVALPFGLDPATTPVLGSFLVGPQREASLETGWYRLPENRESHPLLVISAAGRIGRFDADGIYRYGQSVVVEFGRSAEAGVETVGEPVVPFDIGPAPTWRNLRVDMQDAPADADVMRVRVDDNDLTPDQWAAITPPRAPELVTVQEMVGSDSPVLLDWAVSLQFPCQRPFAHHAGVAELPEYRILPDRPLAVSATSTWMSYEAGGPLGWVETAQRARTIPSYLRHDWNRDWGSIEAYTPLGTYQEEPPAPAEVTTGTETRWGWWQPEGPIFVTDPE